MQQNLRLAVTCVVAFVFFSGCGGAAGTARTGETAGAVKSSGKNSSLSETPKVVEARNRCEQEIKNAELQPPDLLEPIQIHACIYALRPQVDSCYQGPQRNITLKVIVEKNGSVSNVFPVGENADNPEAKCVATLMKSITFPQFKGQTQQVIKYPFALGHE